MQCKFNMPAGRSSWSPRAASPKQDDHKGRPRITKRPKRATKPHVGQAKVETSAARRSRDQKQGASWLAHCVTASFMGVIAGRARRARAPNPRPVILGEPEIGCGKPESMTAAAL